MAKEPDWEIRVRRNSPVVRVPCPPPKRDAPSSSLFLCNNDGDEKPRVPVRFDYDLASRLPS